MAAFPELRPDRYRWVPSGVQTRIESKNGEIQINEPWPGVRRTFQFGYGMLSADDVFKTLLGHFHDHKGSIFTLFDWWEIPSWKALPVGSGDGATTVFTLPAKSVVGHQAYVDGAPTASDLNVGTGPEGEDEITFAVAPANGTAVTFRATTSARHRFKVLYAVPELVPEYIEAAIWGASFECVEDIRSSLA